MTAFCAPFLAGTDANRTLKDDLAAVTSRRGARRRLSVTDLLNPRHAFFQRTRPDILPSPERQQAMMAGTGFHEAFGRAISTEEFVEQLVEYEEIVGKIDIYEDRPLELKTTASIPTDILNWRTTNVEQLGMYCTMVGAPHGRLLYYRRAEYGRPPALRAFDLEFADPTTIRAAMIQRRELLRSALQRNDPADLPRCEWFGRDCDYTTICRCDLAEPLMRMVGPGSVSLRENQDFAASLLRALPTDRPPRELKLTDLVFPRKAIFRQMPATEDEEPDASDRLKSLQRRAFEEILKDAVWYGFPGASRWTQVGIGSIRGSVLLFRDVPTVLRVTGKWEMVERKRLAEELPHYVDRVGLECALVGSERGRLIIYYSAIPEDKFMVYEFWFKALAGIRAEMERRLALLEAGAPPEELPACQPPWMQKFCQWKERCGCAEAG